MGEPDEISDPRRIQAVLDTGLLDSQREPEFDQLTRLAARLLEAPSAFLTIISKDREFIKSAHTASSPNKTGHSQPLDMSFSKYTVADKKPLVVEDARKHELVRDQKAVSAGVIAYVGVPLQFQRGEAIGALCVVDCRPRIWSTADVENLQVLARSAMKLIDDQFDRAAIARPHRLEHELVECVTLHLKALDLYTLMLQQQDKTNLEEERSLRYEVTRSFESLRKMYELSGTQPEAVFSEVGELLISISNYIQASDMGERSVRAFADGSVKLSALESSVGDEMSALDALRLAALRRGAEL